MTLTGGRNLRRAQSTDALLSENFAQAAALPAGWNTIGPVKGTTWEVGEPSGVATAKNIRLEFRFTSNPGDVPDSSVWSGFHIDDVCVELAAP